MTSIIAFCGLTCTDCPAYMATQANDYAALRRVRDRWRQEYGIPQMTTDDVACDGCAVDGLKCRHCAECDIRECGMQHGVANCAGCVEYETCAKLARFFDFVPHARATLDAIRHANLAG